MDKNVLKRMKEVEQAVHSLEESVRGAAFSMMKDYILVGADRPAMDRTTPKRTSQDDAGNDGAGRDVESFFADKEIEKPADAVYAIAAFFYSQYGAAPFTVQNVQDLADQVGLTVPGRIDMTLRNARTKKRKLFQPKGGAWEITTMGEIMLKEKFDVKKGRRKRPVEADDTS